MFDLDCGDFLLEAVRSSPPPGSQPPPSMDFTESRHIRGWARAPSGWRQHVPCGQPRAPNRRRRDPSDSHRCHRRPPRCLYPRRGARPPALPVTRLTPRPPGGAKFAGRARGGPVPAVPVPADPPQPGSSARRHGLSPAARAAGERAHEGRRGGQHR